jgi:hypothetical protein
VCTHTHVGVDLLNLVLEYRSSKFACGLLSMKIRIRIRVISFGCKRVLLNHPPAPGACTGSMLSKNRPKVMV